MTTNDFFLIERAAQIQRLRAAGTGNRIEIPGRLSRVGYSRRATQLFRTMDRICRVPLGDKRTKWLDWLTTRGGRLLGLRRNEVQHEEEPLLLTPEQRDVLNAFERQLVHLQLEEDAGVSTVATAIVSAILRDHDHFTGLKPLQFHSDNFAYELLFPSWLNLYTALVHPQSSANEPRFSQAQIKTVFDFLYDFEDGGESPDAELVGALTLVANRLPLPEAQPLIQRIFHLSCPEDRGSRRAFAAKIGRLHEQTNSAAEFLRMLKSVTIFETCALDERTVSIYQLGPELPGFETLPQCITKHVRTMEDVPDKYPMWAELVERIAHIVAESGGIDSEFAEVLQRRTDCMGDLLALLTPREDGVPLSGGCQRLLARIMLRAEAHQGSLDAGSMRAFARHLAPRLELLDGPMAAFFEKEFIHQDNNREMLLRSCEDDARRRAIARQLVTHAQNTQDPVRLLSQLTVAAILNPDCDSARLSAIKRTITVLRLLQEQGYISSNQLEELAGDIRKRLPDSLEFLVAPYLGASDQEGRLAKLYLALYEECEKYEQYGETGNFGLTTAAYGNLKRTIDRDA